MRLAARRRHPHRELPARRDARASASTIATLAAATIRPDLRLDLRLRADRARRGEGRIRSGRAGRLRDDVGDRRARRPPVKAGVPLTDLGAGLFALAGDSRGAAPSQSHRPRPAHRHVAASRPASRCPCGSPPSTSRAASRRSRWDRRIGCCAPYQAIRCADGYITLGGGQRSAVRRAVRAARASGVDSGSAISPTTRCRVRNRAALIARIEAVTSARSRDSTGSRCFEAARHPVRADQRLCGGVRRPAGPRARDGRRDRPSDARAACGRSAHRSRCPRRRRSSAGARRCSASTPKRSCGRPAATSD